MTRSRPARTEEDRAARRQAILDAALDEFSERGFAAARLEDVAARARVAKGTVYLYFPSKNVLFEELVRTAISEPVQKLGRRLLAPETALSIEEVLQAFYRWIRSEVLDTKNRRIVHLVLAEGARFPEIAAFYHREVISRGLGLIREIASRTAATGAARSEELVRFPHLAAAPAIVALLWTSLFDRHEPLDTDGLFDAYLALLTRAMQPDEPP